MHAEDGGEDDGLEAGLTALFAALRQTGLPVGLGAESLETVRFAVEKGIVPDYWVVAFLSLDYPAATLKVAHNSIWCRDPEARRPIRSICGTSPPCMRRDLRCRRSSLNEICGD